MRTIAILVMVCIMSVIYIGCKNDNTEKVDNVVIATDSLIVDSLKVVEMADTTKVIEIKDSLKVSE